MAATCPSVRQRRIDLAQAKRQRGRPRNTAAISWICEFPTGIADWKRGQALPHMVKAEGSIHAKRLLAGPTMTARGQNGWSWHIVSFHH